jgi:hypothetical protein
MHQNSSTFLPSWQHAFRVGFAPQLTYGMLAALAGALERDEPALIQGATVSPPPLHFLTDWPVEAACGLAFGPWQAGGCVTVGQAEEAFAQLCAHADALLGEPAGCRHFINWFDETPREEMRLLLLAEVRREMSLRQEEVFPAAAQEAQAEAHPELLPF